jgi:hypothetical protein
MQLNFMLTEFQTNGERMDDRREVDTRAVGYRKMAAIVRGLFAPAR